MENKKVIILLSVLLAASCFIMAFIIIMFKNNDSIYVEKSEENIIDLLAGKEIYIETEIPSKIKNADVYVIKTDDYTQNVSQLIGNDSIKSYYKIPDGEIILLNNNCIFEFKSNFMFKYAVNGNKIPDEKTELGSDVTRIIDHKLYSKIKETVISFIESGNKSFDNKAEKIDFTTVIDGIYKDNDSYYVKCSRNIDGNPVTDNAIICLYENGTITEAQGKWCFLSENDTFSADLVNIDNILFSLYMDNAGKMKITDISLCYSLNYYGDGEKFCLAPYWKIITDDWNEYCYSALDGTLFIK